MRATLPLWAIRDRERGKRSIAAGEIDDYLMTRGRGGVGERGVSLDQSLDLAAMAPRNDGDGDGDGDGDDDDDDGNDNDDATELQRGPPSVLGQDKQQQQKQFVSFFFWSLHPPFLFSFSFFLGLNLVTIGSAFSLATHWP